ncbi:MAG TPA: PilZ domain-containing protein [Thermoanaerobaculia bacterium]|nr:PilZ domain-containing protein [Thermoanaerobaculia bacterium]
MGEQSTILLANRSRGTLLFDQALLQGEGRRVRMAARGTEAWRIARESRPRLVVFAFDLGDLRAPELCRLLRNHEATRRVSLLLLGERSAAEQTDLCVAAGCNEVIYRPVHRSELEEKVEKLLSVPPRRTVRTLTRIELNGAASSTLLGQSVNLSSTGMLLQLEQTLPPSARLMLQFFLADGSSPIRVHSEIVRAEFTGGTPRYGVRFVDVPSDQRTAIDSFVRQVPEAHA